jgi:hypothetical protein
MRYPVPTDFVISDTVLYLPGHLCRQTSAALLQNVTALHVIAYVMSSMRQLLEEVTAQTSTDSN